MIYIDVGQAIQYWYERREKKFKILHTNDLFLVGKYRTFLLLGSMWSQQTQETSYSGI